MKIRIETSYTLFATTDVELPVGKTWGNVVNHFIKYGTLYLKFDDETAIELACGDVETDSCDYKYPDRILVHTIDTDGLSDRCLLDETN
jgi:hypothetical protein